MALAKSACALLVGSFALLAILAALQTSLLAKAWQTVAGSGSWSRRLTSASHPPTSSVQLAAQKLGATFRFGDASTKPFGDPELEEEANIEDDITTDLNEAEARGTQWRLQSAESHFNAALSRAESWLHGVSKDTHRDPRRDAKDTTPRQKRERATRKAIEVLTRLGSFLEARGRPEDAAKPLRRAEVLAVSLTPTSPQTTVASPEDTLARARVQAAFGRVLCIGDGRDGKSFLNAQLRFNLAIEALAKAQAAVSETDARMFSPLAVEVRADLAECLLGEGDLAAARATVEEANRIVESDITGSMSPHLRQRLALVRAGVAHDDGKFDEALRLYNEYLQVVGSSLTTLPDPNIAAEMFDAMQDVALVLSSKGQFREAFASINDILRLQRAADAELQAKSQGPRTSKFLAGDVIDPRLWAAAARTHIVHAEVLLEESRATNKPAASAALTEAKAAVTMLRRTGRLSTHDLENALNTLGNVFITLGRQKYAEAAYTESLTMAEQRHGTSSPIVAALYHNLGCVLELRGAMALAMDNYQRAYEIQMKTLGFANPDTAETLSQIARVLEKQGKWSEAADAAARAAESTRISYPEGHWQRTDADQRAAKFAAAARPTHKIMGAVLEA